MHRTMQRLHPFGMRNWRGQDGRQIIRHLPTTHRNLRGMHQMPFAEDGKACGAAAHINHRGAKLLFIFHQGRKPGGQRGGDKFLNFQITPHQAGTKIAERCFSGRDHM